MDKAIAEFFDERKTAWLKKNLKASMSEDEVRQQEVACEHLFELDQWLPNAANRAGQMSIATHPCTFSHPSARKNKNGYASSIIAKQPAANDGFLRTGNVQVGTDALGNAAALDVYKFLTLVLSDGQTLLKHIESDSDIATGLLDLSPSNGPSYTELKQGFLAITQGSEELVTSSKIKQVFFPVDGDVTSGQYHQLSLLTPSGIVFDLRKRLDNMRFGDDIKAAREKRKSQQPHISHREMYNLATIGYGGTKPQNISVLNNQNGGKAHLLMSLPPSFLRREKSFPRTDFFKVSVRYSQCRPEFYALHNLYSTTENNKALRNHRDDIYCSIVDHIIDKMWQLRAIAAEQFYAPTNTLPHAQLIWLCEGHDDQRANDDEWLTPILLAITQFITKGYSHTLGKKAITLGDTEYQAIYDVVASHKEALR